MLTVLKNLSRTVEVHFWRLDFTLMLVKELYLASDELSSGPLFCHLQRPTAGVLKEVTKKFPIVE